MMNNIFLFLCGLMIGLHSPSLYANDINIGPKQNLFRVDEIKVQGVRKVESEAILEKMSIREGMMIDNYLLAEDVKKIYSMRHFEYVRVYLDDSNGKKNLVVVVQEKPIISAIKIEGNDGVEDSDLLEQIKIKQFSILDINSINKDLEALEKFYEEKGYFLASINYEIRKVSEENVEVVFQIQEFDKIRVKNITILGNQAFNDGELKSIMETREEHFFSFLNNAGNFKEFNFKTDIERLKYFYKTKGYLQIDIGTPEVTVSEDKKWIFITFKVVEGPVFSINKINFNGEVLFPDSELREKIQLREGETYSEATLRNDIITLTEMYQDQGYAFANVLRTLEIVPGETKVNLNFSFEKGSIAYFGEITVKGNTKTRDKVIRRELKIIEGMKYSGSMLRESKDNVNRLGFFDKDTVVFNTVPSKTNPNLLDVVIDVQERNTGQISLGAGYSTASKGFIQGSISQSNFRGLGQNLSLSFSLSDTTKNFNLGFTEPYFLDTKWTTGGDIFYNTNETSDSQSVKRVGGDARIGYPIFDYTRLFLTYKWVDTTISNVQDPTIVESVENGVASSIEATILRDKRNNRMEPSRGYFLSLSTEFTGLYGLGGEKKWVKTQFDGRYYKNLIGDLVFRSRLLASRLFRKGREIPRNEKFVLGGPRNMRGFPYEGIGPKQTINVDGVRRTFNQGGLFSLYSAFEFEHPLVREAGLKWVVFLDAGNIFDNYIGEGGDYTLRTDYGFGLRWFSPIGVLRFEFGYPFPKKAGEDASQFFFDIGQLF